MSSINAVRAQLESAQRRGEVAFCRVVGEILDRAQRLGTDPEALPLYSAIAELDINDRTIEPAVNDARRFLEARLLSTPPSIQTEYEAYLARLPAHQRHVMLARQCLRGLASNPGSARCRQLRQQAIALFEKAREEQPLGKKDERIYLALKGEQPGK